MLHSRAVQHMTKDGNFRCRGLPGIIVIFQNVITGEPAFDNTVQRPAQPGASFAKWGSPQPIYAVLYVQEAFDIRLGRLKNSGGVKTGHKGIILRIEEQAQIVLPDIAEERL